MKIHLHTHTNVHGNNVEYYYFKRVRAPNIQGNLRVYTPKTTTRQRRAPVRPSVRPSNGNGASYARARVSRGGGHR